MFEIVTGSRIPFMRYRRWAYGLSLPLIPAGVASLAGKGGFRLGVDFAGGSLVEYRFDRHIDTAETTMDERMHTTHWSHATNIENIPPANLVQIGMSLQNSTETRMRFLLIMAGLVPLALLLAGFGGWLLARRALQPVARMTEAAQRIGAEQLAERVEESGTGDELDHLAKTLNQMLGRLDELPRLDELALLVRQAQEHFHGGSLAGAPGHDHGMHRGALVDGAAPDAREGFVRDERHGARVAGALGAKARHVVVPDAGHGVMGLACLRDAVFRFIDAAGDDEALQVDADCARALPRPPDFVPITAATGRAAQ